MRILTIQNRNLYSAGEKDELESTSGRALERLTASAEDTECTGVLLMVTSGAASGRGATRWICRERRSKSK